MTQSSQASVSQPDSLEAGTIIIRPCMPGDPPLLLRIEQKSFHTDLWSEGDFLKYDCLVAVYRPAALSTTDSVVAGFLVSHEVCPSQDGQPAEREILNIAVDPEFRRRGIGHLLLAKELARGGIHFLEVRESNAAARELYDRQGFETVGRRKAYYDHPRETAMLMRREPPQGAGL